MPIKELKAIAEAGKIAPAASSMWTPDNVLKVTNNIMALIKEAKTLYPMLGAGQQQGGQLPRATMPNNGGGGVNSGQLKAAAKMLIQSLQQQGYGQIPLGQVIANIPFTVDQVSGFLDNPMELVKALNAGARK